MAETRENDQILMDLTEDNIARIMDMGLCSIDAQPAPVVIRGVNSYLSVVFVKQVLEDTRRDVIHMFQETAVAAGAAPTFELTDLTVLRDGNSWTEDPEALKSFYYLLRGNELIAPVPRTFPTRFRVAEANKE